MDPDHDLVLKKFILNLTHSLEEVSRQLNEKLHEISAEVSRCDANLTLLEKKVLSTQSDNNQ